MGRSRWPSPYAVRTWCRRWSCSSPAVFSVDTRARRWAGELREELLAAGDADPQSVARTLFDLTLGPELWEGIPEEARGILTAGGPTVLAEINGRGLDLSTEPFTPTVDDLSAVLQPTLVLTGQTLVRRRAGRRRTPHRACCPTPGTRSSTAVT